MINNVGVTVASMGAGECFGEMGLVFSITRTASIKACGPVKVTSLSKEGTQKKPSQQSHKFFLNFRQNTVFTLRLTTVLLELN